MKHNKVYPIFLPLTPKKLQGAVLQASNNYPPPPNLGEGVGGRGFYFPPR